MRASKVLSVGLVTMVAASAVWGMQAGQTPWHVVSAGDSHVFSVRGGVLLQQGEAREIVFDEDHQLSELIWDIKGLMYAGGSASLLLGSRFQVNASYWTALNEGSGEMQDYDWFVEGADWTHFSDGRVDINEAYTFDINGTFDLVRSDDLGLYIMAGYKQMYWDWSQYGGSFIYSVNGFRDFVGQAPDDENGINYDQTFQVPYAGLGASVRLGNLHGSGYLIYSPIVQAEDNDEHVLRNLYFTETFENIDYLGMGGELVFNVTDRLYISGAIDLHSIPEARGDMEIRDAAGNVDFNPDSAGIENTAASVSAMVGLRF